MRQWLNFVSPYDGWIIRSDGKQRLTVLDNLGGDIPDMAWSPTRDLLLVTWVSNVPTLSEERQIRYYLIDPDAGTTLATIPPPAADPLWYGIPVWSADGQYAVVYHNPTIPRCLSSGRMAASRRAAGRIEPEWSHPRLQPGRQGPGVGRLPGGVSVGRFENPLGVG